ncbi:MAG: class I SAM-dependent methyltransferase [Deltaproteobacteria bacterium]|nr:class I SAM-dependent methyltransferase [Deltaproteobacteria bacterium]
MNDSEFRLLQEIEESHWWFVGKRYLLRALLGEPREHERMIDLGCGTGGILRDWMSRSRCVGVDRSELALQICKDRGFPTLARANLTALPFREGAFDSLLLLDVIEHLDDDRSFLRQASALCREGGRVVVAVPAFQFLWSQHDETFEHRRRYSARGLEAVVRDAGLVPERLTYTNLAVFPVAAVWRVLSYRLGLGRFAPRHDFWPIPSWLNALLIRAYAIEGWLLQRVNLPVGVSLVCIARVPEDTTRCNPAS